MRSRFYHFNAIGFILILVWVGSLGSILRADENKFIPKDMTYDNKTIHMVVTKNGVPQNGDEGEGKEIFDFFYTVGGGHYHKDLSFNKKGEILYKKDVIGALFFYQKNGKKPITEQDNQAQFESEVQGFLMAHFIAQANKTYDNHMTEKKGKHGDASDPTKGETSFPPQPPKVIGKIRPLLTPCEKFEFISHEGGIISLARGGQALLYMRVDSIVSYACMGDSMALVVDGTLGPSKPMVMSLQKSSNRNVSTPEDWLNIPNRLLVLNQNRLVTLRQSPRGRYEWIELSASSQNEKETVFRAWTSGVKEYTTEITLDGSEARAGIYPEEIQLKQILKARKTGFKNLFQ